MITIFLLYVPGVNRVFGGRPVTIWGYMTPGIPFGMIMLYWEEARKTIVRFSNNRQLKINPKEKTFWELHIRW